MEPIILFQQKWGESFNVPWYLFLGGLAGGTLTLGALVDLLLGWSERVRSFPRAAAYVTVPAIVAGGLSLSFHLGKPERGFAFPLFFTNYQSWLTIGGWVIGTFAPVALAYAAAWYFGLDVRLRRALAVAAVPLGILMSLYTGFLLSAAFVIPGDRWYVPLWDARYLPVLFMLSGFSTGLAACGLALLVAAGLGRLRSGAGATAPSWGARFASFADIAALLAEGAWLYLFVTALAAGSLGQQLAFRTLTAGPLAPWFWWGVVATGLVAPIALSIVQEVAERLFHARLPWALYAKFVLVLVGGILLRYTVVWGGDLKSPLAFPPSLWPIPTLGGITIPTPGQ